MFAVAHTKRGEQSAADAATADLPLIQAAAARTVDTSADAFKASIDGKTVDNRGDAAEALSMGRQTRPSAHEPWSCRSVPRQALGPS
ncbi:MULTISPECIES: hypothetical protein [unclassified Pseudarthrobacter]|uniref:hypothetical protein n=1 Tax=unclassified Pseudarthrobacter TaxID=2647000 RepID=UPI003077A88A